LGPNSLPTVVAQPDKDKQTEQFLCWSGMTDTEHTTSGSNEEAAALKRYEQFFQTIQKLVIAQLVR